MVTAGDIATQKRHADEAKRQADALGRQQKDILRKQISDIDRQIAQLQVTRSKASSDLSLLG